MESPGYRASMRNPSLKSSEENAKRGERTHPFDETGHGASEAVVRPR